MADNLAKVTDMKGFFNDRVKRMEGDEKLYLLEKYILLDEKANKIPDAISVTLPEPRMFAEKVFAILNSAHMQSRVRGKGLSDAETSTIEQCIDDLFTSIDNCLMQRNLGMLRPWVIEQDCIRGTIITKNLLKEMPDGTYVPHIVPCDAWNTVYEFDDDGLAWVSPQFVRTRAAVEKEYPNAKGLPLGRYIHVRPYVDREVLETYIEKEKVAEEENTLGYVPYTVIESSTGPRLMNDTYFKYRGESIYAVVRDLYPEINRHASILTTLDMLSFLGGWQYESEMGELAKKPEHPIRGTRKVIPVEKGAGYKPLPIHDIRNASRMLQYLLLSALQRATFSNMEYGTLTMPLSAVAISKMMGTRDAILLLRLHDMAMYYRQTASMLLKQYVKGGIQAQLGEEGLERTYDPKDIDKKFAIFYDFTPVSPEQDIANTAVAQQQRQLGLSWRNILTNTLKVQDVAGELEMERREMADRMDVGNVLFDQVYAYRDMGDKLDDMKEKEKYYLKAELTLQQLETILKQRAIGQLTGLNMSPNAEGMNNQVKPMIPLLGGGGQDMSQAEEQITPDEQEQRQESRSAVVRRQTEEG